MKEVKGELIAFSEVESKQLDKLRQLFTEHAVRTLQWWWDVGEAVIPIYQAAEAKEAGSGRDRVRAISASLRLANDRCLMDAMYVVERWKSRQRYEELIKACTGPQGNVLSISHVKELSRVNDDKVVFTEAKAAAANNTSCAALRQSLTRKFAGKKGKKRGPGRKPLIPSNLEECLASIERELSRLRRLVKESWCSKQYNIIEAIRNIGREAANMTDEKGTPLLDRLEGVYQLLSDAMDDLNQFSKSYVAALNKLDVVAARADDEEEDYSDDDET